MRGWIKGRLRLLVYFILFYSGILRAFVWISKKAARNRCAIILFYHRFKGDDRAEYPSKLPIASFERQMKYLKKVYRVIGLDELVERMSSGQEFEAPGVVVTIDDGFKDNYDLAYPVLRKLELPATIFLSAGYIGTTRAPWVDEIGRALSNTRIEYFRVPEILGERVVDLSSEKVKGEILHEIYEKLLYLPHEAKQEIVERLLHKLMKECDSRNNKRIMLNWEEIREMKEGGISFGAHTISHPTLSRMPLEDAVIEIEGSKEMIERYIESEVKHFAVPNGKEEDFSEDLRDFCRNGVFESVCTTEPGKVEADGDRYRLARIGADERLFVFAVELARAFLGKG